MTWIHSSRFAKKVRNAGGVERITPDEPDNSCPACNRPIDNDTAPQDWTVLPAGVKFDPNDKEILDHLAAKLGRRGKAHPLIDEFIPTLEDDEGICCMHPELLPGAKNDGSSSHFFHRPSNAYTKGTRKRRKVQTNDEDELRWHKTGKTRAVTENGEVIGWKKIMVLYTNFKKKTKPKKTNWVLHQYHLGDGEDEREGELVMSKVFYQTQPRGSAREACEANEVAEVENEAAENEVAENGAAENEVAENEAAENEAEAAEVEPDAIEAALELEVSHEDDSLTRATTSTPEVVRPYPTRATTFGMPELYPSTSAQGEGYFGASASASISLSRCSSVPSVPAETYTQAQADLDIETLICDESFHYEDVAKFFEELGSQDFRGFAEAAGISCEDDLQQPLPDWDKINDMSLGTGGEPTTQDLDNWLKSESQE